MVVSRTLQVTSEAVIDELTSYGIGVVGTDPISGVGGPPRREFQDFITRYSLAHDTPFFVLPRGWVVSKIVSNPGLDHLAAQEVTATNCWYFPAAPVDQNQHHQLMIRRLAAGETVTLIRQTATALNQDAKDFQALTKSWMDKFLLRLIINKVCRDGKPVLLAMAPPYDRPRSCFKITSVRWRSAGHLFASIRRETLNWAD